MDENSNRDVLKHGLIVALGPNMFSLPKLQWFTLRSNGLFYSSRERGTSESSCPESVIEFETMFVRVEKMEEENSKFAYRAGKITVYCLRVGDKRKCRILCFTSWEERDFWMISILTAIAQFKISGESRDELCGKIRCTPSSTLRSTRAEKSSFSSVRVARTVERKSIRKRFTSLRSRKSMRDSNGDFTENLYVQTAGSTSDVFCGSSTNYYGTISPSASFSQIEDCDTMDYCRLQEPSEEETCPQSPRFEKFPSTVDFGTKKRNFASFITKFA